MLQVVAGFVWCHRHGVVHDDTLNPYDYEPKDWCDVDDHQPIYARLT